jgi:anaerobic magnesium-protoporphyrin IX monomethyl ester cyclase
MIEGTPKVPIIPPLGIALLASKLRNDGFDVSAIDAIAEAENQFNDEYIPVNYTKPLDEYKFISMGLSFKQIADRIPDDIGIIGISAMFSINWPLDRALIHYLANKFPSSIIIAGGESTTGMAEHCLKQVPALKVCILGEGEDTLSELVTAIVSETDLSLVNGIIFRNKNGDIIKTPPRSRIRNVDDLPIPAWDLFPIKNYQRHAVVPGEEARITLSILATRGCPYECTFCTSPDMWGTRYFMRKPENVVAEIEYVKDKYGATNFEFFDLTAIIQKRWIIAFAKLLVEKKLDITWKIPAGTRSEAIDEEVSYWLKKSGCYFITYAPESGSPRLLDLIKKKVSLPNILQSIRYAKKQEMIVYTNMIMGLPDETHRDIWSTLFFMLKCRLAGVDDMPLAIFRPYPGSALFDRLVKESKIRIDNDDYVIDSLFIIDTLSEQQYYNTAIAPYWYKIYIPLAFIAFYGVDYIKNPSKILRTIRNISEKNYETELERKIANPARKANLRTDLA